MFVLSEENVFTFNISKIYKQWVKNIFVQYINCSIKQNFFKTHKDKIIALTEL